MDYVDAPYMTMKQRQLKPADSFQSELRQKMRQRKSMGLTADLTSEESEGVDDGHDSEEENSLTMKYRMTHKRTDRPTSAKRRGNPDLGETLRADDANKWLKSNKHQKDSMSTLRETPPPKESPRFSKQPSRNEIDQMFGTPRSQTSPLDKKLRQSPVESPGRASPGSSLPKSLFGKTSPNSTRELTQEEKIFGRKTPTNESPVEKEWKAPSFKRPPFGDPDRTSPSAELDRKGGRKTPVDSSLKPIDESPRPQPRSRFGRTTSPKDSRLRSRDSSPRELSLESPRSERPKPKVDLFGRKEKHVQLDDDDEVEKTPSRERRRFQRDDKHAGQRPTNGRQTPTGRKTPTGRETPTGRKTPTGRHTPTGRNTPTGKQFRKEENDDRKKEEPKEKGLFDFLTDDKPKATRRAGQSADRRKMFYEDHDDDFTERKSGVGTDKKKSSLRKSTSQDSITQELLEQPSMLEASSRDDTSKKIPSDQSSVCFEIDEDPDKIFQREKQQKEARVLSKNQRSDRKEADDIISRVEDAQTDPKPIRDRPASARTQDQVLKPKPRHTLPGSRPSSASTERSDDMFNSSMSIRQTIFEEWRKVKSKEIKEKTLEQKKKEEDAKKKKEKDERDKKLESLASYQAWMKQKEGTFVKEKQRQKKEEEKKKKEEEKEKLQQKKEAIKNFQSWKEAKDERLIEQHKKKVEEKHRKKQEERSVKKEKEKDNESAFKRWKTKKEETLEENHQKQQEEKLKTQKMLIRTQKQKEQDSVKEYNEWLKKKEQQKEYDALRKRQQNDDYYDEFKPAWSPASKVIPCGR